MISILLFGARGRMGQLICEEYSPNNFKNRQISITAGVERDNHPEIGKTFFGIPIVESSGSLPSADVWVDFSLADPAMEHTRMATEIHKPIVIAATGFNDHQLDELKNLSGECPILVTSNLSIGMGVMDMIVGEAAKTLGDKFDSALVEFHHSTKRDAPSGTALRLSERIELEGFPKPQTAALRVGGAIGEHQIRFVGHHEELVITHRAWSRQAFSSGIIRAVEFVANSAPGYYSGRDMYKSR